MEKDPCAEERKRAIEAAEVWEQATEETRRFMVTRPLDTEAVVEPRPPSYFEEMNLAFENEELARKKYVLAMSALAECQENTL